MRFFSNSLFLAIALSPLCLAASPAEVLSKKLENVEVHLKNPIYSDGVLETKEGGILYAPGLRIQAQEIHYEKQLSKNTKVAKVLAQGDLLVFYEGQFFTGSKLEYDFVSRTGLLLDGRTSEGIWFTGGDKIELKEDGTFLIHNAFLTTCESQDNLWALQSKSITAHVDKQISASDIQLRLFDIPVAYIPSFKTNTGFVSNPPIRYKLLWDKGIGPRATIRYRVLSKNDFNLFARLDYRLEKGPGAAIETEYLPKEKRTTLVTRSYVAHDKVVYDESTWHRYRLQGLFTHKSLDEKTYTHASYDKLSDIKMISDFAEGDFEVNTQERTLFLMQHQEENVLSSLLVEPRLNPFESINQKLPLVKVGIRPFTIGSSGILSENTLDAGYLNYVYATNLLHSHPSLRETHSARLEMKNKLYRSCLLPFFQFTPFLGATTMLYSNNQAGVSVGQAAVSYGGLLSTRFYHNYPTYKHQIEPYVSYEGLSKPLSSLNQHYIFTIADGLYQINSLKIGLKNTLSQKGFSFFSPSLQIDLYTYHFFFTDTLTKLFPKAYLMATWSQPSYKLEGHTCWNFQESVLDFCNLLSEVTVSENAAFTLEFRHRSRFDWRKSDHDNFLVDMAQSISSLEESPLSDGRNTLLGQLMLMLSPKWRVHFGSHYGWGRNNEPAYSSFKIDALTSLTCKWQLKFSYTHTTNDDRFSMQMQLNK